VPTILVINDDGIASVGLVALKKQLEKLGRVIVVAPKEECSGVGKALTAYGTIRVLKTKLSDGSEAYAITGTPADAYHMAVNKILKKPPDLVATGINLGPNLGIDDMFNSGTLGASLEAAIHKIPTIAVSYCMPRLTKKEEKADVTLEKLEPAASIAKKTVEYVLKNGMPEDVDIISINVPENAKRKVKVTRLSYKGYGDIHIKQGNGYKIDGWSLTVYPNDEPETDVHTIKKEKSISVTPIKIALPHKKERLKELQDILSA